ncbi:PDZ domain-containing protein [Streptomyces kunmingensis]|uniref:PDZ domain-containing protein n=1 Tax=Streptomyces kunmingensis TaxID=68225 RepID=A0ABU6C9W0_9ACTN|nr:PDZ domain-containing protein [Streptomyces kunmingensis]MEB3961499.1 PDZ domain-containing protein [Streptomyces kunmingensis]
MSGLVCALVLVLAGVGLGTVGATVIGMSRLAELRQQATAGAATKPPARPTNKAAPVPASAAQASASASASASVRRPAAPAAVRASLGVEVVDASRGPGALVVAVHAPGPGYAAGLVRGDVLTGLGAARVGSAGELAALVSDARPGHRLLMTIRHANGTVQQLAVTPGVVT